jgi:hypothetical protein
VPVNDAKREPPVEELGLVMHEQDVCVCGRACEVAGGCVRLCAVVCVPTSSFARCPTAGCRSRS